MNDDVPPAWKLPTGVNASLWRYAHTERLAIDEDDYFAAHPLFDRDAVEVDARFTAPGRVVDLGSGSGRHAIRFAVRGFSSTAVELSEAMLREVGRKAEHWNVPVVRVKANLCRLTCFPDDSFDYGLSMFSTIGMIRGPKARRIALIEAARILKPGGRLALHVHNIFLNLRDAQGRVWLREQLIETIKKSDLAGDRRMRYRGLPGMEVHLYRWSEIKREIARAGLKIDETLPLDEVTAGPIPHPWFFHNIRAGGWLIFCRKPARNA